MAKKYEINVTLINEDGTREPFTGIEPTVSGGFVIMAMDEMEKDGHKGVQANVVLHEVSEAMIMATMIGHDILRSACTRVAMEAMLRRVLDERPDDEGEDAEDGDDA